MPTTQSNEKNAISQLQRFLRRVFFDDPSVRPPPVDGIFERDTEVALRAFQRAQGLPETGRADQATWERLFDAYRAALALTFLPEPVELFPAIPSDYALRPGSRGFVVTALQYMLGELQYNYDSFPPALINGEYDETTARTVRRFQELNGLPITGETDRLTWNRVTDQHNTLARGYQAE
ncbi:MAG: peptidoglycan-binding protein [Clostridia bacterium]|nr:peptidoglycan-binding protein [Clostridia bacterium]